MDFDKLNFHLPLNHQQSRAKKIAACTWCKKKVAVCCRIVRRKLRTKSQRIALVLVLSMLSAVMTVVECALDQWAQMAVFLNFATSQKIALFGGGSTPGKHSSNAKF